MKNWPFTFATVLFLMMIVNILALVSLVRTRQNRNQSTTLTAVNQNHNKTMMDITPEESARMAAVTGTPETQREMPRYQCHKKVWALKIKSVELRPANGHIIHPADEGFAPFVVTDAYVQKHKPEAGGYYVRYEDGYESYSPAKAFEDGYTLIQ